MVLAGCDPGRAGWFLFVGSAAYTAFAGLLVVRPSVITNDWPTWAKRVGAVAMVLLGVFFMYASAHGASTGECL
ncbi:MAG: hypothetical protein ACTHN0_06505 [Aquihabitans sp.]